MSSLDVFIIWPQPFTLIRMQRDPSVGKWGQEASLTATWISDGGRVGEEAFEGLFPGEAFSSVGRRLGCERRPHDSFLS